MRRELLAGLLLLAMAGGLYWHNLLMAPQSPTLATQEPDFVARAMTTRAYNEHGRLNAEIAADRMLHYQPLQLTEFTKPVYLVYPEGTDTTWKVTANFGVLEQNRYLHLRDQVQLEALEHNEPINRIRTQALKLDLETMIVSTDEALEAQGENLSLTATGLIADLKLNLVSLLHKVSATYDVQ